MRGRLNVSAKGNSFVVATRRAYARAAMPLATVLVVLAARGMSAQATPRAVSIPDQIRCATCQIAIRHVVTLGKSDGPGSFSGLARSVTVDRRGRYWVITNGDMPSVFDSAGVFIRHVGAPGRGPQEFVIASQIVALPGDSMLVFDVELQRASVIGPTGEAVRWFSVPFELLNTTPVSWPTNVWASGVVRTREAAGWPIHRYSAASDRANLLTSFGPDRGELRPGITESWHSLVHSARGTVWAADDLRFRITEWSAAGSKLRELERVSPHFRTGVGVTRLSPREPPPSVVRAIHEDELGNLWLFVSVAHDTWRDAWTDFPSDARGRWESSRQYVDMTKLWRTMVEVVDPTAASVLARQYVDDWVTAVLPNGRAVSVLKDNDDTARIRIIEFTLRR